VVVCVDEREMVSVAMGFIEVLPVNTHICQMEMEHTRTKNGFIPSFRVQVIFTVTPPVGAFQRSFMNIVMRSERLLVTCIDDYVFRLPR